MLKPLYRSIRAKLLHELIPESRAAILPPGGGQTIEVVGLLRDASGIGESARLCVESLRAAGYRVSGRDVGPTLGKRAEVEYDVGPQAGPGEVGCRIFHLNPGMMPPAVWAIGARAFSRCFNIGYWAWELEEIPPEWKRCVRYMNAVLTPSEFSSAAVRRHTPKPVITVPHPVRADAPQEGMRGRLGVPHDAFLVTSVFSFGSSFERKHPIAAAEAFWAAFESVPNAFLVLKCTHASVFSAEIAKLRSKLRDPRRMIIVDAMWPKSLVLQLISEADVYLSLHRSEGFGLTLAEAIMLETPVIATGWSGNTDFCTDEGSYLIGYELVPVSAGHPDFIGLSGSRWAEPDVGHAAAALSAVHDSPPATAVKAARAKAGFLDYLASATYSHAIGQLAALSATPQATPRTRAG